MSSSDKRVQKITSMSRSELKSLIGRSDGIEPEERHIIRNYQTSAAGPSYPGIKIIHRPPHPTLEAQARPYMPDWQQVSRGPAIEAPFLREPLIIIPPPKIDPMTLTNKPNSGQLIFDYINNQYPDKEALTLLGKTEKNKKDLIQYISSLDDAAQEEALNKVFDPKTPLHFFFSVPRSFLFNTNLNRGSFETLGKLLDALRERQEKTRPEDWVAGGSMDIFEPRPRPYAPGFNEALE